MDSFYERLFDNEKLAYLLGKAKNIRELTSVRFVIYMTRSIDTKYVSVQLCYRIGIVGFFLDLPRFSGVKGEQDNWMQWIDDSNSDEIFDLPHIDIDVEEFVGGNSHLDC